MHTYTGFSDETTRRANFSPFAVRIFDVRALVEPRGRGEYAFSLVMQHTAPEKNCPNSRNSPAFKRLSCVVITRHARLRNESETDFACKFISTLKCYF